MLRSCLNLYRKGHKDEFYCGAQAQESQCPCLMTRHVLWKQRSKMLLGPSTLYNPSSIWNPFPNEKEQLDRKQLAAFDCSWMANMDPMSLKCALCSGTKWSEHLKSARLRGNTFGRAWYWILIKKRPTWHVLQKRLTHKYLTPLITTEWWIHPSSEMSTIISTPIPFAQQTQPRRKNLLWKMVSHQLAG